MDIEFCEFENKQVELNDNETLREESIQGSTMTMYLDNEQRLINTEIQFTLNSILIPWREFWGSIFKSFTVALDIQYPITKIQV